MIYLLDTNACIGYLRGQNASLVRRLSTISPGDIAVCSIVKTELFYGAMLSRDPTRTLRIQQTFLNQFVSLPFDDQAAAICGRIRGQLATQGIPIGPYDVQISAIAIARQLICDRPSSSEASSSTAEGIYGCKVNLATFSIPDRRALSYIFPTLNVVGLA